MDYQYKIRAEVLSQQDIGHVVRLQVTRELRATAVLKGFSADKGGLKVMLQGASSVQTTSAFLNISTVVKPYWPISPDTLITVYKDTELEPESDPQEGTE